MRVFGVQEIGAAAALLREGGVLESSGTVDLSTASYPAAFFGVVHQLPIERALAKFFYGTPPVTGTAKCRFDLRFPLQAGWIRNLNGTVHAEATHGVVAGLKTFYLVMSFTNLTHYLTLSLPDSAVRGIPYEGLAGSASFRSGVLKTDDLYLHSQDVDIAASGTLDLPASRLNAVVKIQVFRFLQEVISRIPGVQLIFKNGHKILLPLPVHLQGPLDDIQAS